MRSDFPNAHRRHWRDAELLFENQRWANADHLYGMATECGLKGLMGAFGMPFDAQKDRPQASEDRTHADGVWRRYEIYRSGHLAGAGYALSSENPFHDWGVAQRYANESHFTQEEVRPHRESAEEVRRLVRKARLDGVL